MTYRCEVDGSPAPTLTWYYNGGDIPDGVSVNDNELVIADPQVSHSGIYQCRVVNSYGQTYTYDHMQFEDSRMWTLEVREPGKPWKEHKLL